MGDQLKKSFYFNILVLFCLSACGGGSSPAPTTNETVTFAPPGTTAPETSPDVVAINDCGALPGQWIAQDLATGASLGTPTLSTSSFTQAFRKSWGGTTTAYTIWKAEAGDMAVWNEGRRLHVGNDVPLTTTGMISAIALTGTPGNMTALIGTDQGLVVADLKRPAATWTLEKQVTVAATGPVRSIAISEWPLEVNGPAVPLVYVVANESVLVVRLDHLKANTGCMDVAYQAKDHPVDLKDPKNKRRYRPIKVVAANGLATFLTASRLPEEFANAAQLQSVLDKEWTSFQSTAYLINVARTTPVLPFIMQMGAFDRFMASDVAMDQTHAYFFGSRYTSGNPAAIESGVASYTQLTGTPILSFWSGIPKTLPGDYRLGRLDVQLASASVRGLDRVAKVTEMFSGPTQEKWVAWKNPSPLDYGRGVAVRHDKSGEEVVVTPQLNPGGPTTYIWAYMEAKPTEWQPTPLAYTTFKKVLHASPRTVSYFDEAQNKVVMQHLSDASSASFPLVDAAAGDTAAMATIPRLFHVGNFIVYARHGDKGPRVRIYDDAIVGDMIPTHEKGPMAMGFALGNAAGITGGGLSNPDLKVVGAFENMGHITSFMRLDDVGIIHHPQLPALHHLALLVHYWNGSANSYRVLVVQMNLAPALKKRTATIVGCSDLVDPNNNYSANVAYGSIDDQPRFIGSLRTSPADANGDVTLTGFFQHHHPVYNVWSLKMTLPAQVVPDGNACSTAGELLPLTAADIASGISAAPSENGLVNLHADGFLRWIESATMTRVLDVGKNILGGPVTTPTGQVVAAGAHYLVRLDTTDGFHPTALLDLDGNFGESCPSCQFTDAFSTGATVFTAHPERGVEMFEFAN